LKDSAIFWNSVQAGISHDVLTFNNLADYLHEVEYSDLPVNLQEEFDELYRLAIKAVKSCKKSKKLKEFIKDQGRSR
jgi:hypothetical protein